MGEWVVDPTSQRLRNGTAEAQLEPRLLELLHELARHQGRVRTRRQLTDAVWQTEYISDNSLTHAIAELRALLGDDARSPSYIETIPKKGYRLIAPVSVDPATHDNSPAVTSRLSRGGRWWIVAACIAATGLPVSWLAGTLKNTPHSALHAPRIVVLPFHNLGDPEDQYFSEGITEEITSRLSSVRELQVISRTSASAFAQCDKTIAEIGDALNVDYVLEGSVRWEHAAAGPDCVRITPQLIRVSDDAHLWTESFEREIDEIFAVQTEIGQRVAEQLNLTLFDSASGTVSRQTTRNLSAYQAYLQGGAYLQSGEQNDLESAIVLYSRATELEPGFGLAHARLALSHAYMANFGYDDDGNHALAARRAMAHAEALSGGQPEIQRIHATLRYYLDEDLKGAIGEYESVLQRLPNSSESLASMAYVQRRLGLWSESQANLSRALELDPLNTLHLWNIAINLMYLRHYAEADQMLQRALDISPDMRTPQLLRVSNFLAWDGSTERARQALAAVAGPRDQRWLVEAYDVELADHRFKNAFELLDSLAPNEMDADTLAVLRCECASYALDVDTAAAICSAGRRLLEDQANALPGCAFNRMKLAKVCAYMGNKTAALTYAHEAMELFESTTDAVDLVSLRRSLAIVYCLVGETERAITELEALLRVPSPVSAATLSHEPHWNPLRGHPRFERLCSQS